MRRAKRAMRSALLLTGLLLAACSPLQVGVGAGATAGVAAAEDRGLKQAAIDTGIELRIKADLLQEDPHLLAKLGIKCVEGRVLLTGVVQQEPEKAKAEAIASREEGVRAVVNEIQVHAPLGLDQTLHDAFITASLRTDLLGDSKIADINYSITTVDGVVYLFGIAQSSAEVQRVIEYARATPRVKRIIDDMLIKGDPRLLSSLGPLYWCPRRQPLPRHLPQDPA